MQDRLSFARFDLLVVLGPTASCKTGVAVQLARRAEGEILSADSRQVYRELTIGAGKDLGEYHADGPPVPYHLIDLTTLSEEFSVCDYQQAAFSVLPGVRGRGRVPVLCGGTGLYIDAVLSGRRMVAAPEDPALRAALAQLGDADLAERLTALRPKQHNTTDLNSRERTIRAIEIALAEDRAHEAGALQPAPPVTPLILRTVWRREVLRERIRTRLRQRLDAGLIGEVRAIHATGVTWERLDRLGLEYRYVGQYLRGEIRNENDLRQKLAAAIIQFARRQETWFRRMERHGATLRDVPEASCDAALHAIEAARQAAPGV